MPNDFLKTRGALVAASKNLENAGADVHSAIHNLQVAKAPPESYSALAQTEAHLKGLAKALQEIIEEHYSLDPRAVRREMKRQGREG